MNPHVDDEHDLEARAVDLTLWRRLWAYTRPYRLQVTLLILCALVTAGVDITLPLLTRALVDDLARPESVLDWRGYAVAYLGLTILLAGAVLSFIGLAGYLRTSLSHDIRRDGFDSLQRLSFSYFDSRPVGWLMARMTSDCERLSNILAWGVLDLFWGTTVMLGIGCAMLLLAPSLALVALTVVPVLAVVSVRFQRRILVTARLVRRTNSRITAAYNEELAGVRTAKAFVREERNLADFARISEEMRQASVKNALQSAVYLPIVMTLASVATGAALAVGGQQALAGAVSIGTLLAFLSYTRLFFEPVQELARWLAEMQMAQASAERILGLIATRPEIDDSPAVRARLAAYARQHPQQRAAAGAGAGAHSGSAAYAGHAESTAATGPALPEASKMGLAPDGHPDRVGAIELRAVDFSYAIGPPVLRGIDLTVQAGERIALVGPTGGGKTTLVNLVCRFYEPTAGAVLLDGIDVRERSLAWYHRQLGIVLQTPHLFSGTVAENLRYGCLDATDDELRAAAVLVGASAFIEALPLGYDSPVGEGGVRLSTGQKQLISFARAVLARPQILILDEATSSIDTETEQLIQRGLERVLAGRTSFIIAHRLSTVRRADRILFIEAGRIVEQGSHVELLARRGRYFNLYMQQSLRESHRAPGGAPGSRPGPAA